MFVPVLIRGFHRPPYSMADLSSQMGGEGGLGVGLGWRGVGGEGVIGCEGHD